MLTDEFIIARGYKQYERSPIDSEIVVSRFQKRFDDKYGKKYFINVIKNSQEFIPADKRGDWWVPYKYTYEVQMSKDEDDKTMNLEFFADWPIEAVEDFVEEIFQKMKMNYYELFDSEERHTRPEVKK